MSEVRKIRKKPVVVEAMQWTGGNADELMAWTGGYFEPAPRLGNVDRVWDKLHASWVNVLRDQWVIRGVQGEYYPCDDEVLRATYDFVDGAQ